MLLIYMFFVMHRPGDREPVKLKCNFSGSNLLHMGEELQSDINIIVMDKDGNDLGKV